MGSHSDELMDLDYTAYDHVSDFRDQLESRRMSVEETRVSIGFHYDEGVPVIDVHADDGRMRYLDSYELEGLSPEAFEAQGYELWLSAFEDDFDIDSFLEEYDHGNFRGSI